VGRGISRFLRPATPGRRAAAAAGLLVLAAVVAFGVVAPPERCPAVTAGELRASAGEATDWFARNQDRDGTWLYLYDRSTDTVAPEYNVVRHSGVTMSLYQAAAAGVPGALEGADQGTDWALQQLVLRDGWAAVRDGGDASVGATALLTAGLVERRVDTGDDVHDGLLRRMGGFLRSQTEATGAVLARYDLGARAPVPGLYSKYYTGEAYWALARLHRVFPDEGWGEVADSIGAYLAVDRDRVEDVWPPVPDHWAAYGLAETVEFEDRDVSRLQPLTEDEVDHARRQAGLFGAQTRWVSQQAGPWGALVRGPVVPRGGGYGVMGEAFTGLWHVARADARLADMREPIAERALCTAALAVREQVGSGEAESAASPDRVRGAWFLDGETRMDDQQHALSALLRTVPIAEAAAGSGSGSGSGDGGAGAEETGVAAAVPAVGRGEWPVPSIWLWLVVLLAAYNPFRVAAGVPRSSRSRSETVVVAALGGLAGSALVVLVSLLSGTVLDTLDVSRPALRIAAGVIGTVSGIAALVRPAPAAEPALPGRRAALVPVAIPLTASPALVLLGLSAHADRGSAVVLLAVVLGTAALAGLTAAGAAPAPADVGDGDDPVEAAAPVGPRARVARWAARLTAAVLVALAVLLVIDGVFDI
jgi:small neutral amino acid transporter SnatA (MarC family)